MKSLLLRLDDACEYMDIEKWRRMEALLETYDVKPLVGIIPAVEDGNLKKYGKIEDAWDIIRSWIEKGWTPALHGYTHVFETSQGGINPVNARSEFAGVPYERQLSKIIEGVSRLKQQGINAKVFYSPAHTFDMNTLRALKDGSDIRIISDTPASRRYCREGVTFVPQQSGRVRELNFETVTYCYHPNTMKEQDFEILEAFLQKHRFDMFPIEQTEQKPSLVDHVLMKLYYWRHRKWIKRI